jgi:ABC-type uncharacterized transport system permease subunit
MLMTIWRIWMSKNNDPFGSGDDDKLVRHYDTILKESALLTTFSGILFGFLLNISVNTPSTFTTIDVIILIIALYSITVAASLFVMPVVYHHVQYPYGDLNKFKIRSHRFILSGLVPAGITLYLGLQLAIHSRLGTIESFILASFPFILVYFLFKTRKQE